MKNEYVILNLEKEYPGYTGTEKWMIITDLTEEEFASRYPEISPKWKQAVIVSEKIGREIVHFQSNERKYLKHAVEDEVSFETLENVAWKDEEEEEKEEEEIKNPLLREALELLSPIQHSRIVMHYLEGYSSKELAETEGVSVHAINKSIKRGRESLKETIDALKGVKSNA